MKKVNNILYLEDKTFFEELEIILIPELIKKIQVKDNMF